MTRRSLLERMATLAGIAAAARVTLFCGKALAQAKVPKQQAKYQDTPKGDQRCSGCINFQAPSGCRIVEGQISPNGWCQFFAAKGQR